MQFDIITLFPELIAQYTRTSIIGRAVTQGVITVHTVNPREFSTNTHRKVDDEPYGGGAGMVMSCQPLDDAYHSLLPLQQPARVLITTPAGRVFDHTFAVELAQAEEIVIFCGHYEGIDERIFDLIPELEPVSLGEMVLTGGELPALCIIDAVSRLIPGTVQKQASVENDSFFKDGLLDHPHYTRPAEYKGLNVPDVLLSGNHAEIARWRAQQSHLRTQAFYPSKLKEV